LTLEEINRKYDTDYHSVFKLEQNEYSLSRPEFTFKDKQDTPHKLVCIGVVKREKHTKIILHCEECSKDKELHGDGLFVSTKSNINGCKSNSFKGKCPCGGGNYSLSKEQAEVVIKRYTSKVGSVFNGFIDGYKDTKSNIIISCLCGNTFKSNVDRLKTYGCRCKSCASDAVARVYSTPTFVVLGKIHKILNIYGNTLRFEGFNTHDGDYYNCYTKLNMHCMLCNNTFTVPYTNFVDSKQGCPICARSGKEFRVCYINGIYDKEELIGVKFGITSNTAHKRCYYQNSKSCYSIRQLESYRMPSNISCIEAENECLKELQCKLFTKQEVPDGYTETTHAGNISKIVEIYKKYGGVKIDDR